jgi:crotonobetainyl-CoA:carnitine CoA-transferase CaiB-like acyl-CoA transferase
MGQSGKPSLEGVRVLDFSRIIAGPLCTQQLSDLGTEIIKIENPETGDDTRRLSEPGVAGQSQFFLAFNRNKRSVGLDIRQPAGQIADPAARASLMVALQPPPSPLESTSTLAVFNLVLRRVS